MKWNPEKLCFVADDGSKLKPTRSLVGKQYGNCGGYQSNAQKKMWINYLLHELYGVGIRKNRP